MMASLIDTTIFKMADRSAIFPKRADQVMEKVKALEWIGRKLSGMQ
jgi:hypothetical protein